MHNQSWDANFWSTAICKRIQWKVVRYYERWTECLALDNIEQSRLLEDPDLWKEFHKRLSNEDIPEGDEDDDFKGTKGEQYNQKPTPDIIGDTYLSAELAIPRHGYEYPQYTRVINVERIRKEIQ